MLGSSAFFLKLDTFTGATQFSNNPPAIAALIIGTNMRTNISDIKTFTALKLSFRIGYWVIQKKCTTLHNRWSTLELDILTKYV